MTAIEALNRLCKGNQRFVSGQGVSHVLTDQFVRGKLVSGQQPFAVVLGCSDSRVPAEIVFDQGLGSLFVIRVAGNIVAQSQIGSVEFAVSKFRTPLVVVLGHSQCGAVTAAVDGIEASSREESSAIGSIIDAIKPAVQMVYSAGVENRAAVVREAVRINVQRSTKCLRQSSQLLESAADSGKVLIVGAEYSLETGVVDFFEGVPTNSA